jgi:hypothetical protein
MKIVVKTFSFHLKWSRLVDHLKTGPEIGWLMTILKPDRRVFKWSLHKCSVATLQHLPSVRTDVNKFFKLNILDVQLIVPV